MNSENQTPAQPSPVDQSAVVDSKPRLNLPLFCIALLGPAVLTTLAAFVVRMGAIPVGLILGVIGGATCALQIMRWMRSGVVVKVLVGLVLGPVFILVSLFLCMMGCTMGGGEIRS